MAPLAPAEIEPVLRDLDNDLADPNAIKLQLQTLKTRIVEVNTIPDLFDKSKVMRDLGILRTKMTARVERMKLIGTLTPDFQTAVTELQDTLDREWMSSDLSSLPDVVRPGAEIASGGINRGLLALREYPIIGQVAGFGIAGFAVFMGIIRPILDAVSHPVDTTKAVSSTIWKNLTLILGGIGGVFGLNHIGKSLGFPDVFESLKSMAAGALGYPPPPPDAPPGSPPGAPPGAPPPGPPAGPATSALDGAGADLLNKPILGTEARITFDGQPPLTVKIEANRIEVNGEKYEFEVDLDNGMRRGLGLLAGKSGCVEKKLSPSIKSAIWKGTTLDVQAEFEFTPSQFWYPDKPLNDPNPTPKVKTAPTQPVTAAQLKSALEKLKGGGGPHKIAGLTFKHI